MKLLIFLLIASILCFSVSLFTGCNSSKIQYKKLKDGIILTLKQGKLMVTVYSEKIINIRYSLEDNFSKSNSLVLTSVPQKTNWKIEGNGNFLELKTELLKVKIDVTNGAVTYYDNTGDILLKGNPKQPYILEPAIEMCENIYNVECQFLLSEDEGIYGLGQFPDGYMNYRGKEVVLVQTNIAAVNPFLISTKKYGILWDNYSKTKFKDGEDGMSFASEVADEISYYFVSGDNMDDVIVGYRFLTGDAPLFGKWAYGYWQSKERYTDREELLAVAFKYRERNIPIDNIVQDWRYWGDNEYWSSMKFNPDVFPEPEEMISILHNKYNMHLMVSIWPALGIKTDIYREMKQKGFLYPPEHWSTGYVYDAYNTYARNLYWKYIHDGLISKGVDALWMDGTEPELEAAHYPEISEKYIKQFGKNAMGTMAKYLNTYSLMTTKGVYNGFRKDVVDKRVFILTRSAFSGQQRYAAVTWSGDVSANWETFRNQISAGLNFCMAGIPYWTHDIGAFFVSGADYGHGPGLYPDGCNDPAYKEFYVRWFQFGAFTPVFRSHGTQTPREVWQFGEKRSWAYETLLKFLNLRYRLLPYIYSIAWKVTNGGYTMMRGLPMDFTNDKNTYSIGNQYMFGPAFLICPVTKEMYHKAKRSADPIPEQFLVTPDKKISGFKAEYYNGINFNKKLMQKVDHTIDFSDKNDFPKEIPKENFSARWTGKLITKEEGKYEIGVISDDGVKLLIDDKLIIDKWLNQSASYYSQKFYFKKETCHRIKLEYFQGKGKSTIKLVWKTPAMLNKEDKEIKDKSVDIYLPESQGWYDFWTGEYYKGGQYIKRETPIDIMPLYIKSGSIVPMGPFKQYAVEKQENPIELRIYTGKDAEFVLYEDENDNYNYEKGIYSIIPIKWNQKIRILTIGKRVGEYPGMLQKRTFNVVIVTKGQGTGVDITEFPDKTIIYKGDSIEVNF